MAERIGESVSTSLVNEGKNPPSFFGVLATNPFIQIVGPGEPLEKSCKKLKEQTMISSRMNYAIGHEHKLATSFKILYSLSTYITMLM